MECKIATKEDIISVYAEKIANNPRDEFLHLQLERRLMAMEDKTRLFFVGTENKEYICELAATISPLDKYTQNIEKVVCKNCAYLFSFFTKEKYRGKGYFSKLYRFAQNTLSQMGFEYLTLGVEVDDLENIERYKRWGYDELIYQGSEEFDGLKLDVLYYRKKLGL